MTIRWRGLLARMRQLPMVWRAMRAELGEAIPGETIAQFSQRTKIARNQLVRRDGPVKQLSRIGH